MPRLSKVGAAALGAFGWTGGASVTATYLVVAGGAGGGAAGGGGGGGGAAGGYRTGTLSLDLASSYTVTVGAGGASGTTGQSGSTGDGTSGSDSIFSSITSTGGGGGGAGGSARSGKTGGSGGGGGHNGGAGGAGNTPSTSPSQGNNGGTPNAAHNGGGGGGGASAAGATTPSAAVGGAGGAGTASSISGSSVTYAGGGGGASNTTGGAGGAGGGGAGGAPNGVAGTANLGGGGGGGYGSTGIATAGGSGIVIISYVGAQQFGGGVVTSSGGNTIHTFTTSGTLVPATPLTAQYLIVGGGGGGGGGYPTVTTGGGGGAGGFQSGSGLTIDPNSTYLVTVGAGGTAGGGGGGGSNGGVGGNSAFSLVTTASVGGGYGAWNQQVGGNGGSGGGASGPNGTSPASYAGGTGTAGQGNNGGAATRFGGAGGGGAGAVGITSGVGGIGLTSSISGTSTYYAGGGGCPGTLGGLGGGGQGSDYPSATVAAGAGTIGTGGGGGGGGNPSTAGAAGGSGTVIISYAGATQLMAGGTVTISGGNVIHTFTSTGFLAPLKLVNNSLRFRNSASAYLNRTPTVASNRTTWTWSGWVKRGDLSRTQGLFGAGVLGNNANFQAYWNSDNTIYFQETVQNVSNQLIWASTPVYRDPSAWYHIVIAMDTTQATATNRSIVYVNGIQIAGAFSVTPSQNQALSINNTVAQYVGAAPTNTASLLYLSGYMTEVNFIDGQALTPSSFGTINSYGVWQPITYGGSYGTNGFYLPFTNTTSATTLAYDFSPQGNNWTPNNISVTAGVTYDSMTDVPTLTSATAANYCVMNPLANGGTLSGGNLNATSGTNSVIYSTFALTDKIYWEVTLNGSATQQLGIADFSKTNTTNSAPGDTGRNGYIYLTTGGIYNNGSLVLGSLSTATTNDVICFAYDSASNKLWIRKNNGTWFGGGDPATGSTPSTTTSSSFTYSPVLGAGGGSDAVNASANFGQRPFTYTAPSGYVALNTYNL